MHNSPYFKIATTEQLLQIKGLQLVLRDLDRIKYTVFINTI